MDALSAVLFAELDSVRLNGVSAVNLEKVQEQQRRERELQIRDNGFWLNQIVQYDRLGWDLRGILDPPLSLGFTPDELRDAAARFLDPRHYVQVSLYPERLGSRE